MKQSSLHHLALVVVSLALVLAACGDDDASTTSTSSQISTTATVASSTTSATTSTVPEDPQTVTVYFSTGDGTDCAEVGGFEREAPGGEDPIRAAFEQLVAGPTGAESDAGASSFFSAETAGTLIAVTQEDELLMVDFEDLRPLIPNASASCGSTALLAQLNATAFQFPEISTVRYEIAGSCDTFANWLQRDCQDFEREG